MFDITCPACSQPLRPSVHWLHICEECETAYEVCGNYIVPRQTEPQTMSYAPLPTTDAEISQRPVD